MRPGEASARVSEGGVATGAPGLTLQPGLVGASTARGRRWSGDAWLLLRGGDGAVLAGALAPSYGASQYGLVVRRSFGSASRPPAFAYLRLAGATAREETQLAAGLGVRPVPRLPVAVLAEGRVQRSRSGTRLQPGVAVVSELPPVALPLGLEANVYAQGGWLGGADATAFVDAQAIAERRIALPVRGAELRLGAGVWGGGQKGAKRLDAGPRAALRTSVAGIPMQVAADWRVRIAGDAQPGSGPALTISAGF